MISQSDEIAQVFEKGNPYKFFTLLSNNARNTKALWALNDVCSWILWRELHLQQFTSECNQLRNCQEIEWPYLPNADRVAARLLSKIPFDKVKIDRRTICSICPLFVMGTDCGICVIDAIVMYSNRNCDTLSNNATQFNIN